MVSKSLNYNNYNKILQYFIETLSILTQLVKVEVNRWKYIVLPGLTNDIPINFYFFYIVLTDTNEVHLVMSWAKSLMNCVTSSLNYSSIGRLVHVGNIQLVSSWFFLHLYIQEYLLNPNLKVFNINVSIYFTRLLQGNSFLNSNVAHLYYVDKIYKVGTTKQGARANRK